MTKPHTPDGSGESLRHELVTLIMHPIADLVERARVEILEKLNHLEGLIDTIAGQKRPELDGNER